MRNDKQSRISAWFFKTDKGGYGEGDKFLGVRVPKIRRVVKENLKEAGLNDVVHLLRSPWHEVRFAGCILMVELMKKAIKNGD